MNKIYNEDCFNILKTIESKTIKLIITDPPYLHNKGGGKTHGTEGKSKIANSKMFNFDSPMMKDMSSFGENEINVLLGEFKRVMIKMNAFIFCNDTQIPYYLNWCLKNKKKFTILTWEKPLSILNRNRYSQNLEYIVRIYDNGTGLNKLDISSSPEKKEFYSKNRKINPPSGKLRIHPCQKPEEYIKGILELNSSEGDIVLDCFMGSGVVGKVAIELNRRFIGIEKNSDYFNMAIEHMLKENNYEIAN